MNNVVKYRVHANISDWNLAINATMAIDETHLDFFCQGSRSGLLSLSKPIKVGLMGTKSFFQIRRIGGGVL